MIGEIVKNPVTQALNASKLNNENNNLFPDSRYVIYGFGGL